MQPVRKLDSAHVRAALQRVYGPPESVIFFEVANATGTAARRWADAVSMGCWPSRGMLIHGFEIKTTKYDWRREKAKPIKAETIASYCDLWSVVTVPGVIEDEAEIPPTWGWLEVDADGRIRTRRAAQRLDPKPLDRGFVASLLRSAGQIDQAAIDAAVAAGVESRTKLLREGVENRIKKEVAMATLDLQAKVGRYERAAQILGPEVREYMADEEFLGAVRLVLAIGATRTYDGLWILRNKIQGFVDTFDEAVEAIGLPTQTELFELDRKSRELRKANGGG